MAGPVVKVLLSVFLLVLKISNAFDLQLYVGNQFTHVEGIQISVSCTGKSSTPFQKKLSGEEELEWKTSTNSVPSTRLTCDCMVLVGDSYKLLGSFTCFKVSWFGTSNINRATSMKLKWIVKEEGASLLEGGPDYEVKHAWNIMILIFTVANEFSNQHDIVISIADNTEKYIDIVANQKKIDHGKTMIITHSRDLYRRKEARFKCFVDKVLADSREYIGFFGFSMTLLGSDGVSMMRVIKTELTVNESGATMIFPTKSILEYKN